MARKSDAQILRDNINILKKKDYTVLEPFRAVCLNCQKPRSTKENWFYQSNNPYFSLEVNTLIDEEKEINGVKEKIKVKSKKRVLPICKNCLLAMWKQFCIDSKDDKRLAMYKLTQELRIPWIEDIWTMCEANDKNTDKYQIYMQKLNSLPQYSKLTMFDSEEFIGVDESFESDSVNSKDSKISKKKLSLLHDKYGHGFTNEEYLNFERKYEKMSVGYNEKTALHTERFITYIIHKVKEEMATAEGDIGSAEKWGKMATSDADKAKLNVSQLSKSDITGGIDLLPQLIEAVEEKVSLIPIMPKLKTVPYDDVDMTIYALMNYYRRLEDLPPIEYKDVWNFYDGFINEHFESMNYSNEDIDKLKKERNNIFKDLGDVYTEPLYFQHHEDIEEE